MPDRNLDDIDPTFTEDLALSQEAVWLAARILNKLGIPAVPTPLRVRPTPEERNQYADSGDITIVQNVETKQRFSVSFTCAEDYRGKNGTKYDTVMVDVAHHFDQAHPKPWGYMIFNEDMSAWAWVPGSTHRKWIKKTLPMRGRQRTCYFCPIGLCKFYRVEENGNG